MSALETYLKAAKESKGWMHVGAIRNARQYIKLTPRDDIRTAIRRITDPDLLRLLWEVGLNSDLQYIVIKQQEKIAKGEEKEG
jgi:hypothetical protein